MGSTNNEARCRRGPLGIRGWRVRNLGKAFSVFGHCEGTKQATDGKLLLYSTRVKMEAASCQQNEKRAVPKTGKRDGLSGASGSSSCSAGKWQSEAKAFDHVSQRRIALAIAVVAFLLAQRCSFHFSVSTDRCDRTALVTVAPNAA